MDTTGYIRGMLDRDQRTAISVTDASQRRNARFPWFYGCGCRRDDIASGLRNDNNEQESHSISHVSNDPVRGRTIPSSRRVRNSWHGQWVSTAPRLHRTLLFSFCVGLALLPSTVSGAPSTKRSTAMGEKGLEKWMMPCGKRIDHGTSSNEIKTTNDELLTQIVNQSKRSSLKIKEYKEKFARKAFKNSWDQHHNLHKGFASYDWLLGSDRIPDAPLSETYLNSLKLDDALYNTYENLQRLAVGFDQMIADENGSGSSSYKNDFEEMEKYLLSVLCEIQTTMVERKLPKRPDVQRDIMPDNLKQLDNTNKHVRNYMILRDYIKILDYVIETFEHLKQKKQS